MCGSEVERNNNIQQEFNLTTFILLVCILCYLPPTVWQRQIICVVYYSEVERNNIQQEFIQQHYY